MSNKNTGVIINRLIRVVVMMSAISPVVGAAVDSRVNSATFPCDDEMSQDLPSRFMNECFFRQTLLSIYISGNDMGYKRNPLKSGLITYPVRYAKQYKNDHAYRY